MLQAPHPHMITDAFVCVFFVFSFFKDDIHPDLPFYVETSFDHRFGIVFGW